MTTFEYLRDALAVIGAVSVLASLSLAALALYGAWLTRDEVRP